MFFRYLRMSRNSLLATLCAVMSASSTALGNWSAYSALAQVHSPGLENATVLVIRHAEKPPSGDGLTEQGEARANAYAKYFHPFNDGTASFEVDALYATSDTTKSARPKLTLTPLSQALNLPIDTRFGNYDVDFLVHSLRAEPHGKHILIAWHHGKIADLLNALGVDNSTVLPNGKWPDNVYDWVIEIKYDKSGKVAQARRIQENLP
jgi:hypothetical protein